MSEPEQEALRRIEEGEQKGVKKLSLANMRMKRFPDELWRLVQLEELYLSRNRVPSLSGKIGNLKSKELGMALHVAE